MKKFDNNFLKKNILVISDYDDSYTQEDIKNEQKFIQEFTNQINLYKTKVEYKEVKNAEDLENLLDLYSNKTTIVFNWCERFNNTDGTEDEVAKVLESRNFIFTGGNSKLLVLGQDKYLVKQLLKKANISIPEFYLVNKKTIEDFQDLDIDFRKKYFVKSNKFHASTGISLKNIVNSYDEYVDIAQELVELTDEDIIVEKFISGAEYTVIVWGNSPSQALPIIHLKNDAPHPDKIFTNRAKFDDMSNEYQEVHLDIAELNDEIREHIQSLAVQSYDALGFMDYARFDIRSDGKNYYVIDANLNPYINNLTDTMISEVLIAADAIGYNWGETILQICEFAYMRSIHK